MITSLNPATEEVLGIYKEFSLEKASILVSKANKVFSKWRDEPVSYRAKKISSLAALLRKKQGEYAKIITLEMGKPIKQSIAEIEKCAWLCDFYAENSSLFLQNENIQTEAVKSYVTYEPLGVILGIMPWNFPFWQVFRFAIPALCAGNVCIIKHSLNVPQCSILIEKIFRKAGFHRHVFTNLLISSESVQYIIENPYVQGVSLTGSVAVGSKVAEVAGRNIKKVVLELGGSDPFIILEDADMQKACQAAVQSRNINSGQSCIAAKRFIVVKKRAEEFEKLFLENLNALKIGDPLDESTDIGPLVSADIRNSIHLLVQDAIKRGGKVLAGGTFLEGKGFFYKPTLIRIKDYATKLMHEESFGPVAVVYYVKNTEEAIAVANSTDFGLGASIWTANTEKAEVIAKKIQAGTVCINSMVKSDPRLPFGGIKKSGIGRELGSYGLKEFVNIKTIVVA